MSITQAAAGADLFAPLLFFGALIYASVRDIRTREVGDYVHVIIAIIALLGVACVNLPAMMLGAVVSALPLFIAALVKTGSIGGADIKLMAASGLLLGAERGAIALVIGLFLGIVCTFIYRKLQKADFTTPFPLVPYLAIGCVVAYFL
jgi:leader peptidase (prepilin peptidase)/N-methyltransferase